MRPWRHDPVLLEGLLVIFCTAILQLAVPQGRSITRCIMESASGVSHKPYSIRSEACTCVSVKLVFSHGRDTVLLTAVRVDSNGQRLRRERVAGCTSSAVIVQSQKHVIAKLLTAAWCITQTTHQHPDLVAHSHRSCQSFKSALCPCW